MRNLIVTSIAVLMTLLASPVRAADLKIYKAYNPPPVVFTGWSGFYLGVNVGYSWGKHNVDWSLIGFPTAFDRQDMNGVIGGYQSGINWQIDRWVTGIEMDWQASGQRGSGSYCLVSCAIAFVDGTHKLLWFGTARSRIGYLLTPNILLYATSGVAYGQVKSDYLLTTAGAPVAVFGFDNMRVGWTAGAGLEVALTRFWNVKIEYLYLDLGTNSSAAFVAAVNPALPVTAVQSRVTDNIVRVGANYQL